MTQVDKVNRFSVPQPKTSTLKQFIYLSIIMVYLNFQLFDLHESNVVHFIILIIINTHVSCILYINKVYGLCQIFSLKQYKNISQIVKIIYAHYL